MARVSTQQLAELSMATNEKLDTLISLLLNEKLAGEKLAAEQPVVQAEPEKPESRNDNEFKVSDKYKDVQSRKMAEYAQNKGERFYMFGAVNKQGHHKLRFFSRSNCEKYGNRLSEALAYCDPGKATTWV